MASMRYLYANGLSVKSLMKRQEGNVVFHEKVALVCARSNEKKMSMVDIIKGIERYGECYESDKAFKQCTHLRNLAKRHDTLYVFCEATDGGELFDDGLLENEVLKPMNLLLFKKITLPSLANRIEGKYEKDTFLFEGNSYSKGMGIEKVTKWCDAGIRMHVLSFLSDKATYQHSAFCQNGEWFVELIAKK